MDTSTRRRLVCIERDRLRTLDNWQIAHRLTTLADLPRSLTPIEREALMIEAAARVHRA